MDEVTFGGLPKGRTTLVTGGAGSGKTLLGLEFLVQGVQQFGEPGALIAFEETIADLTENVRSLGVDLDRLIARRRIAVDHVHLERSEIHETGEYDLEGLFVRLGHAIDSVGAKRVVIDTLEALFGGLSDAAILRAELRRLFRWLKERRVTAIVTAERGARGGDSLTRHGLEEFVSDCVILLDHRVVSQVTTRRLRIVKYRGSTHGSNEYPFLIDSDGITVLPVTSLGLSHRASTKRISSGTAELDSMLGDGRGLFRGSSILVSGTAGSGKTTIAATLTDASCRRGERALYCAFEESPAQIQRNMRSVGIDLEQWVRSGRLRFHATRPTAYGFETHLAALHRAVREFRPAVVILDPITNLESIGSDLEIRSMLMRLVDYLKSENITALFTALTDSAAQAERSEVGVSSLMDTWILLRNLESDGERNRGLYVLKSRGMAHSNQIREFRLSDRGISLAPVYVGREGVLTGTARANQEANERTDSLRRAAARERLQRQLERKRRTLEADVSALKLAFDAETEELSAELAEDDQHERTLAEDASERARLRGARSSVQRSRARKERRP